MRPFAVVIAILFGTAVASATDRCEPTQPRVPAFAPPPPYSAAPLGTDAFLLGTADLWVGVAKSPWHGLRHKLFWWRPGYDGTQERRPSLTMTIRAVPSGVTSSVYRVATNAHFGGEWAMLMLIDFPAPGCWEVQGRYEGRSVTFVASIEP
jgi:hypothetical protein